MPRAAFFAVLVLMTFGLSATQEQQPAPLTARIEVSLVNVDVTVTAHGEPLRGLARDDFEILEDGVPQAITNFYAVGGDHSVTATPTPAAQPAPQQQPAAVSEDERFRRRVLLLIDNTHLTKFNRNAALGSVEKFINDHFAGGAYDWTIATVGGGTRIILPQTSDKEAIHTALARIRLAGAQGGRWGDVTRMSQLSSGTHPQSAGADMNGPIPEMGVSTPALGQLTADIDQRAELMIAANVHRAIIEAVRGFSGTPGKKIVLIMTGDLGLHDAIPADSMRAESNRRVAQMRDALIREANTSNVSLYILNAEGLTVGGPGADAPGYEGGEMFRDQAAMARSGGRTDLAYMYWVARQTGGRLMPGNSADVSMRQFEELSSTYYSLAYRAPHPGDEKYHHIVVRLKHHRGAELRYREGYAAVPRDVQIVRALLTPLGATLQNSSIPLTATTGTVTSANGRTVVPIQARIPMKDLQFLPAGGGWRALVDLYVSIFDANGRNIALRRFTTTATAARAESEGELIHNATVTVQSGKPHTIIVAVRDQTSDAVGIFRQTVGF